MVNIGTGRLHIYCTGQGGPAVVLEAGIGADSTAWALVQPEVAQFTTVCSYDRAGYGWSDGGIPPRSRMRIVSELHELLSRIRLSPPFVLVGHSFGGEIVHTYTGQYPADVAGLVLVATAPDGWERRMPATWIARVQAENHVQMRRLRLFRWLAIFGLLRLWSGHPYVQYAREHLPHQAADALIAEVMRGRLFATFAAEDASTGEDQSPSDFGERPVRVLSDRWALAPNDPMVEVEAARIWDNLQRELAARSTRGERIIVEGTGHMIPLERPDVVVAAVRAVVEQLTRN